MPPDPSTMPASVKLRYQLSLVWLAIMQALYELSPVQRLIVVAGLILLIPGYWGVRWSTDAILTRRYAEYQLVSQRSFTSALPIRANQPLLLALDGGVYTALINVSNTNPDLALDKGNLKFTGLDSAGQGAYETNVPIFLLPGQKKYIVIPYFTPTAALASAKVEFSGLHWQKRFEVPTVELETPVPGLNGLAAGSQPKTFTFNGTVINHSPYLPREVYVNFRFYDRNGQLLTTTQRLERDIRTEERRTFPMTVIGAHKSDVARIEAEAYTNALDARNLGLE